MAEPIKMCNDCRWVGSGWFLFSPGHRNCYHPILVEEAKQKDPSGYGKPIVEIERKYRQTCGFSGKLWNTNEKGE